MSMLNHPKGLVAILAPCAIILAVRFISSLGPASSAAAVGGPGSNPADGVLSPVAVAKPSPTPQPSEAATAAKLSQYITNLRQTGRVISPMDHAPARAVIAEPVQPPAEVVPIAPDRTELRLTATMGTGPSAAALINGKILRVGDTIAGLTIISIDSAEFLVTLQTEGGDERVLRRR